MAKNRKKIAKFLKEIILTYFNIRYRKMYENIPQNIQALSGSNARFGNLGKISAIMKKIIKENRRMKIDTSALILSKI